MFGDFLVGAHFSRAAYISDGTADMIRGDAYWRGGITGIIKIAHLCESFGIPLELHLGGPAHLQLMGAVPGIEFCELGLLHPKDLQSLRVGFDLSGGRGHRNWIDSEGFVTVPDMPGIGAEIDQDYLLRHQLTTYKIGG